MDPESYIESFDVDGLDTNIIDSNGDGVSDTAIIDIDNDGVTDMIERVPDDDSIETQFDADGDGVIDVIGLDANGDGLYDTIEFPDNGDVLDLSSTQQLSADLFEDQLQIDIEPANVTEPVVNHDAPEIKFGYSYTVPGQTESGNSVAYDASNNSYYDQRTWETVEPK